MHMFIADETNKEPSQGPFFIVGGLVLDLEQLADVDEAVRSRSRAAGFEPGDSFKFSPADRPKRIEHSQHSAAKAALMDDLVEIGAKMIVTVCLHDIDQKSGYNQKMNYSLNTLARGFHKFLTDSDSTGLMVMDRDNERYSHLEALFQTGLSFQDGGTQKLSDRIRFFGMTSDNASSLSSATDIALGCFRHSANAAFSGRESGRAEEVARQMMPTVRKLLWEGLDPSGHATTRYYGFIPRPPLERVEAPTYRQKYGTLVAKLKEFADGPASPAE